MSRTVKSKQSISPKIALALTTALASVALAGCTTDGPAPRADKSYSKSQVALAKGQTDKAVLHAENAVLAAPRNGEYRAMLGAAYLEAGRFQAAATSFNDALELGNTDPRTVLSYALAQTALGNDMAAVAALDEWQHGIDAADLGLALALAGEPDRGVQVIADTLRAGNNTPKVRQNLAYAYALQGNWRAARVMAAEDVPADQLDARISEWAKMGKPEDYQLRVAGLLGVDPVYDAGQPAHLALGNHPSDDMLFAEAAAQAPVEADVAAAPEVAAVAAPAPVAQDAAPARVAAAAPVQDRYVSNPVVQALPASYAEAKPAAAPKSASRPKSRVAASSSQRRMASTADNAADTHLVQLGSFSDRAGAERAWSIYQKRYPQLSGHDVVITEAQVRGKTYFRVAAAGFGAKGASSMCSTVKSSGQGCIAYASASPLPGAKDNGIRVASR